MRRSFQIFNIISSKIALYMYHANNYNIRKQ